MRRLGRVRRDREPRSRSAGSSLHEWSANVAIVIHQLRTDVAATQVAGVSRASARAALRNESDMYALLVAYTDLAGLPQHGRWPPVTATPATRARRPVARLGLQARRTRVDAVHPRDPGALRRGAARRGAGGAASRSRRSCARPSRSISVRPRGFARATRRRPRRPPRGRFAGCGRPAPATTVRRRGWRRHAERVARALDDERRHGTASSSSSRLGRGPVRRGGCEREREAEDRRRRPPPPRCGRRRARPTSGRR